MHVRDGYFYIYIYIIRNNTTPTPSRHPVHFNIVRAKKRVNSATNLQREQDAERACLLKHFPRAIGLWNPPSSSRTRRQCYKWKEIHATINMEGSNDPHIRGEQRKLHRNTNAPSRIGLMQIRLESGTFYGIAVIKGMEALEDDGTDRP